MTPKRPLEGCLTELVSASWQQTMAIGERIAVKLKQGSVVAMQGCLGSGKTCLVKGIAKGLCISETITSPTYTIVCEYKGSLDLYHIDAYRLAGEDDFDQLGLDEIIGVRGVTIIEWSEKVIKSLPEDAVKINIEITSDGMRLIRIYGLEIAL